MKKVHLIVVLGSILITAAAQAAITVTSLNDSGSGSLRQAIADAAPGDTIDFAVTGTITLTSGELLVTNSVTILGPGPANLAVDGNAAGRVFLVRSNLMVTIASLTITNGHVYYTSDPYDGGGGIYSDHSSLLVSNCTLSGNSTYYDDGGGIYNDGSFYGSATLTVVNSIVSGNQVDHGYGGGIYNDGAYSGSATLTVANSTFSGNSGGGVYNNGAYGSATLTVANSTFSSNSGGGISSGGAYGNATLTVTNSTLSNNWADDGSGGGICNGGAYGTATLMVANCILSGNSAYNGGGGIANWGVNSGSATLVVANSTLSNNTSAYYGGAIYNCGGDGSATLWITNSTLSGNSTFYGNGGCIYNNGGAGSATLTVANSTLSGNSADDGSGVGIYNDGAYSGTATLVVANSTLSGNSAYDSGGGIYNDGYIRGSATLVVANSTLSGNSAYYGGVGIYNYSAYSSIATLEISGTILNNGIWGQNIYNYSGTVTSLGYNLSSDDGGGFLTATGDRVNTDPMLGPLADNGGPTWTHALLTGSPAIGAGDPSFTPPPEFDQRGPGFPRVVGARIDIGAFEYTYVCPGDADCDGIPDSWMYQYFEHATGQAPDKSRAADDADGDGQSNLAEFQAGTSPTNGASAFRIVEIAPLDEDVLLTWTTVAGKKYAVQTGISGCTSNFVELSPVILGPGTGESTLSVIHLGGAAEVPARFYRIRLVP